MSAVVHARVVEQLARLRLRYVAERLDAVLGDAPLTKILRSCKRCSTGRCVTNVSQRPG